MAAGVMPDAGTDFGARVARHLRDDLVIWFTTVSRDGTPQPNPVWFIWDGETFLTYNVPSAARVAHVRSRPRVSLNFDSASSGDEVAIFTGDAWISDQDPPPDENEAYVAKYGKRMIRESGSLRAFAGRYSLPIRITPDRVRGF